MERNEALIRVSRREDIINKIRADLYGKDLEILANKIGVSKSCLYSIRSGRTKWPRDTTLLTLIDTLNYELWLAEKGEL